MTPTSETRARSRTGLHLGRSIPIHHDFSEAISTPSSLGARHLPAKETAMAVSWIDSAVRVFFHGLAESDPDWNHPIGTGNTHYHTIQERRPGFDSHQRSMSGGILPGCPLPFELCARD